MELEKEVMEIMGRGAEYAQAEQFYNELKKIVPVYDDFRFYDTDDKPYGRAVFELRVTQLTPIRLKKIARILKSRPGSFVYAGGYNLKIELKIN